MERWSGILVNRQIGPQRQCSRLLQATPEVVNARCLKPSYLLLLKKINTPKEHLTSGLTHHEEQHLEAVALDIIKLCELGSLDIWPRLSVSLLIQTSEREVKYWIPLPYALGTLYTTLVFNSSEMLTCLAFFDLRDNVMMRGARSEGGATPRMLRP